MKKKKRVVLLGGSGFMGRWLTRRFSAEGWEPVVVDRAMPPEPAFWVEGNAWDPETVVPAIAEGDVVFHLIHTSIPSESMADPAREFMDNVAPFARLVEAAVSANPSLFVFISSGGQVYGEPEEIPVKEDTCLNPLSPYGVAKLAMEHLTRLAHLKHGLPYLILRPGNPYGPWQEKTNRHGVVPALFKCALREEPFILYGDGSTVRDYIFIQDFAEAVFRLVEKGAANLAVNIGTGQGTSVARLIQLAERITGKSLAVRKKPRRSSDVKMNVLDPGRLLSLTGFRASTGLEQGMRITWEHLKKQNEA